MKSSSQKMTFCDNSSLLTHGMFSCGVDEEEDDDDEEDDATDDDEDEKMSK